MDIKKLFITLILIVSIHSISTAAGKDSAAVLIIPVYTGDMQHDEMLKNCEYMAGEAFLSSGRFLPVSHEIMENSFKSSDGTDRFDFYRKTAEAAGAELFCILNLYAENGIFKLNIKIGTSGNLYSNLKNEKTVSGRIPDNISLNGAKAISAILENEKLKCRVFQSEGGVLIVNAGQWHGLSEGVYKTSSGELTLTAVDRFSSSAEGDNLKPGDIVEFDLYPDVKKFISRMSREIDENTTRFYGMDKGLNKRRGSAKELIIGTCVMNQGANLCLPGYGSFLSAEYMGIDKAEPHWPGIVATGTLTALHLTLPSMITDFDINFFPWIMDNDKDKQTQRLQVFLWATIPVTFSVSFYDQLAYQYRMKDLLPPLFTDHDAVAASLSVFIPGGGMFYKGYVPQGWGFYLSEISLAGYAVYEWDNSSGKSAAGALLAVKVVEVFLSYYLTPSYRIYRNEIGSNDRYPSLSIGLNNGISGSEEYTLTVSIPF